MEDLREGFSEVQTLREYDGYHWDIVDIIIITVLGTFCGYRNTQQIHQWAEHERIQDFLKNVYGIRHVPCYSWYMQLLGIIDPKSLNEHFERWVRSALVDGLGGKTISFDGKTVRSTAKMENYDNPLHIVSAQIAEVGMTLSQVAVEAKSNEIPAVQSLLKQLEIKGCTIVADALNCQTDTAEIIAAKGANYILSVKGNQPTLEKDIEDYVQDEQLQKAMDKSVTKDLRSDRIELRTGYTTSDIDWLPAKSAWPDLACFGAIHTQFETKKGISSEWHYYISDIPLSAAELLRHVRLEWSVESMHWLLDIHYDEDRCRVADKNVQQTLNIFRKIALNCIRNYKNATGSTRPFSHFMQDCQLDPYAIVRLIHE
jgi:predicted transposase YbfD/YdcC